MEKTVMQQRATEAERAGLEFHELHPYADGATVQKVARNRYRSVLEQECFVGGWNRAFWAVSCAR